MRRAVSTMLVSAVVAGNGAGCVTSMETVRATALDRAAFDLGCPVTELTSTPLGDTVVVGQTPAAPGAERSVIGVTGCGTKAVYVVECVTGRCNAVLNGDARTTAPAPSPASPSTP